MYSNLWWKGHKCALYCTHALSTNNVLWKSKILFCALQMFLFIWSGVYFAHKLYIVSRFDFIYNRRVINRLVLPLCDLSKSKWPFEIVPLLHKIIIMYELEVAAVIDIRVCFCHSRSCKPSYNLTERIDENQAGNKPLLCTMSKTHLVDTTGLQVQREFRGSASTYGVYNL